MKHTLEISWTSLWRALFFVLFAWLLFVASDIFLGLFLAVIISSGLEVLVTFFEKKGIQRTVGVILLFALTLFLFVLVVYLVIPYVMTDLGTLVKGIQKSPLAPLFDQFINTKTKGSVIVNIEKIANQFFSGDITPLGAFSNVVGGFGLAAAVIVSSFYLSLSRDGVGRFIRAVFPKSSEEAALRIYERSSRKIGFWFQSQILLSFIMGFLSWGALAIFDVPHAIILGGIAAIFELVPFVGPILSGALATLFAFAISPATAFYVLILFLIIHQLESHVFVPLLTRRAVDLHPVIVIIALLIGIEVGGVLGAVVAVPAAAVLQEVLEERSSRVPV
ncbi:MAG: AI-2E family transporter [Patescibacteria group bacterium]